MEDKIAVHACSNYNIQAKIKQYKQKLALYMIMHTTYLYMLITFK